MPIKDIKKYILSNYLYDVYEIIPIKFKDTDKQRAVYKFSTDKGPKCLKKVYYDEANLLFVYSIIEWFYQSGINVPRILPTISGNRFVKYNNNLFIVTEWIDGRKCDYDIDADISMAARNLGRMHKYSYNFLSVHGSYIRKDDINWYKSFNKKFLQLLLFNNTALKYNDHFCRIYLENLDYFIECAQHAVYILSLINNNELMLPASKFNSICHLDYVNKNLIITGSDDLYVIDFDKSKIDIPIHDIGSFLKRILKRNSTNWDFDILLLTLENYEKERSLTLIEILGLYAYLEFPQKFWKTSRDYFSNKNDINKDLFIAMLSKVCDQRNEHYSFCLKFKDYIRKRFNINYKI